MHNWQRLDSSAFNPTPIYETDRFSEALARMQRIREMLAVLAGFQIYDPNELVSVGA